MQKGVVKVTFEKGLNEFVEPSRLEMGFSTVLKNWIPEADGSLRTRIGWKKAQQIWDGSPASPASRKVRGMAVNPKYVLGGTSQPGLLVANAETVVNPGYNMYRTSLDDLTDPAATWDTLEFIGAAGWDNTKPMAMVMAGGRLLYCTDDFSLIRAWNGTANTVATIASSRVGRCMTYHAQRVFTAGGKETVDPAGGPETVNTHSTQPWRLWFSGIVPADITGTGHWDTTSLTNPAGFIEVGKDDGQPIEFIAPFDQGLLIGKSESLYYLVGTNPANFKLVPLDAGECAAGRSIVVTPYGAVILGKTQAFLYKGNIPEPIDTPVSDSYGMQAGKYLVGAYIDGAVHIVDANRDAVCVYNLENDTWHIETMGFTPGYNLAYQEQLLLGPYDRVAEPMAYYRDLPTGERTVDESLGLALEATTPEMWLGGAASPTTIRHCYLRYRQRAGDAADAVLTVNQYKDGALLVTDTITPEAVPGVYRKRLDLKGTAYSTQFNFVQTNGANDLAVFDIEEIELHIDTESAR